MAKVIPFRAVRPARDKVHMVVSKSVISYERRILNAILDENPYSFLHVINPEHRVKEKSKPNSTQRFTSIKNKYRSFLENDYLEQDEHKAFYLYQQIKDNITYTGLIAGTAVSDYLNGKIKKHENTLTKREELFKNYLKVCTFNAEPVLLTYKDNPNVEEVIEKYFTQTPEYDFSTTDTIRHTLWVISKTDDVKALEQAFNEVDALYIADGHHRSASSTLLATEHDNLHDDHDPINFFMSYIIPESQLNIMDFNRLIKGTNGLTQEDLLEAISQDFNIKKVMTPEYKPAKIHKIGMYTNQQWYELSPKPEIFDTNHPVGSLDSEILSKNILTPILGIKDLKTTKKVRFVGGHKGIDYLQNEVDKKKADIAFALFPVQVNQLMEIADNNFIMPPKSTWIEPKLRSGLTIYKL